MSSVMRRFRHLKNIFAPPLNPADDHKSAVVEKKSAAETSFLLDALKKNFVFETLSEDEMMPVIDAFEKVKFGANYTLIEQGDVGDYFYVIQSGECAFYVDERQVGKSSAGDSFGELALLYKSKRAATVKTLIDTVLYRLNEKTFRFLLQSQLQRRSSEKIQLLRGIPFLKDLKEEDLKTLSSAMIPARFSKGEQIQKKGTESTGFYIIQEGTALIYNISVGTATYEDFEMKPGDYFGETSWALKSPHPCDVKAVTDCFCFFIEKQTFGKVMGDYTDLIVRARDGERLARLKMFHDADLDPKTITALANMLQDGNYKAGTKIFTRGETMNATFFLIRYGKVKIDSDNNQQESKTIGMGEYFGEEQFLMDVGQKEVPTSTQTQATFTATVVEDLQCGVLTLQDCRRVVDTRTLGQSVRKEQNKERHHDDMAVPRRPTSMKDLKRHKILGAGTFGQVWLVSQEAQDGKQIPYALKVQSKYELVQEDQAHAVVNEKNIMTKLGHPFLLRLVASFKDTNFVYMVLDLVPGGELYSHIFDHKGKPKFMPANHARFYTACVAEGLSYMHRRRFAYRDLKPENIMINAKGYAVIIDFGFTKYVNQKTFTLCGTPLYLAPECILNSGHNWAVDHWALGVMIYEIFTGKNPFYESGMDQMMLLRSICRARVNFPHSSSHDDRAMVPEQAKALIQGFLVKNPSRRLGSLADGEDEVLAHPFFTKTIDFRALRKQEIPAPYVPQVKDPFDTRHFDDWSHLDDKTQQNFPRLSSKDASIFDRF